MKRFALTLSVLLSTAACVEQPVASKVQTAAAAPRGRVEIVLPEGPAAPAATLRQPGDYVVFRFSGSYRAKPVTLSQRVIERDGDILVIDVTVDQGGAPKRLRLRMDDAPGGSGELLSVAELRDGVQRPFGVAAFEKLMTDIVPGVDENAGMIDSRPVTVSVGSGEIEAVRTSYQVRIGAQEGVMRTVSSEGFAWGDVGGDITTKSGKIVYKAEIIDIGGPAAGAMAITNGDDLYEELE